MKYSLPPPEDPNDVDSIMSSQRQAAFENATGRLSEVTLVTKESRFFGKAVHDIVAATTAIVLVLGLVIVCLLAVATQIAGAAWIVSTCGPSAAAVSLAVLGQPPFKPVLRIHRESA